MINLYDNTGKAAVAIDASKEINRGGEGAIYEHPKHKDQVIKVYHSRGNLPVSVLQELMQLPNNFITPLELFYDKQGFLKGLSMKYLDTHKLHLLASIFSSPAALKAGFTEAVKQAIYATMMHSLMEAHKIGVVIGDLNPYNIFVSNKAEVYFIDVDSFQTKSRPHSGIMLPDIRDWVHNNIDEKSDYYAISVMVFQLFTHLHPYKGIHRKVATLEERALKRISVLSGDPELIIPSFYEPFSGVVEDEFTRIFQMDERFLPNVARGKVTMQVPIHTPTKVAPMIQAITEGDLTIRIVDTDVEDIDCTSTYFYVRKHTTQFTVYASISQGTYNKFCTIPDSHGIILGNIHVMSIHRSTLYNYTKDGLTEVTNFIIPINSFGYSTNGKAIYFDGREDTYYLLDVDQMLSTQVKVHKGDIYTKSITIQSGVIQTVMGSKWLLDISLGTLKTLRTNVNLTDTYMCPSGNYGVAETNTNNNIEHYLFAVRGMRVEMGQKLNGMSTIAEKGDYLYIPTNGAMDVYRKLDLVKVATIACKTVTEQSVLKSCNAGILCLTGTTLYLLNKS